MDNKLLDELEQKISSIEAKVLPKDGDDRKLLKVISDVQDTLTTFSTKRERFNQIFKRVPAVTEYLSPGFIDVIGMDTTCEKEVVLSAEKELVKISKQLEEIHSLSHVLDSKEIRQVPNYESRLNKLELIQHTQLGELNSTSQQLHDLSSAYNELITSLTETFVKWDLALSKMEEKQEK